MLCLTPCSPMDCSMPGSSVLYCLCSHSYPLSWWCYLTISSSTSSFSFCLQSFPASGSFPTSWLFAPDGQNTQTSPSASVLPMNIQGWFPLGLRGLISLVSKQGPLKSLLQHYSSKASILWCSAFLMVRLSHLYMTTGHIQISLTAKGKILVSYCIKLNIPRVLSWWLTDGFILEMFDRKLLQPFRPGQEFKSLAYWRVMVPHCGFDLHFSDNEWCWSSFHVFVNLLYVFLGEVSV